MIMIIFVIKRILFKQNHIYKYWIKNIAICLFIFFVPQYFNLIFLKLSCINIDGIDYLTEDVRFKCDQDS